MQANCAPILYAVYWAQQSLYNQLGVFISQTNTIDRIVGGFQAQIVLTFTSFGSVPDFCNLVLFRLAENLKSQGPRKMDNWGDNCIINFF